ncbi:MAG TPA: hypothetical protein VLZ10_12050 [Thermodesulfobacteriota bacterium]|nr:hypothetical protein [Thermodesulfobacteriota bacterium]
MERGSFLGIAMGLERIIDSTRFNLKEAMDQFQGLCSMITAERNVPTDIITETRQTYKKIQDHLTKISGAKQLLEGKYRQYYHRNYQRDREIMEIAFLAKNLYLTFEYTLEEIEAKSKLKDKGEHFKVYRSRPPFLWFQSPRNQIVLLRNLETLRDLDYKTKFELGFDRRRDVIRNDTRSISLFALAGEVTSIDNLQSRWRLREYDIVERYTEIELRGALTHLREVSPSEVQKVIRRLADSSEFPKMKCLLLPIQSEKDLKKEIVRTTKDILNVMEVGEVRVLSS